MDQAEDVTLGSARNALLALSLFVSLLEDNWQCTHCCDRREVWEFRRDGWRALVSVVPYG